MDSETVFRVTRGEPTAEEIAALVTALVSRSAAPAGQTSRIGTSAWIRSARPSGRSGSWRESALPR
ncbi:acyl-CoA carboxylase subunit epsilon [Krasilnikovia sp. MM14-A1259]|uniref:acyl-CoA carboxylase subunit epsilon n=1 Tax=Krasilnikovia sp. MM14-A1259 TaxID=3373539 RepID=UPI00399CB00E